VARRILLGWELGENRGHILRLRDLSARLRADGHTISWASLRLDLLNGVALPGEQVFQAPVWPGLHLETALGRGARHHVSFADALAMLGLDRPGAFTQLLRGWDAILAATRPDAVFGDFAPALLGACRGRIPVATAGIGFVLPPASLRAFPRFDRIDTLPHDAAHEAPLLEEVNRGLAEIGAAPIDRLPGMFAADAVIVAAFPVLDPYRAHRTERPVPPFLNGWSPPAQTAGQEVIVYLSEKLYAAEPLYTALGRIGLPVTVVAPNAGARRTPPNVTIVDHLLSFEEIARRARIVVSNGNTGFVSAAMLAGLPQALLPHDAQKELVGAAVTTLGSGISHAFDAVDWSAWPGAVRDAAEDGGLRDRATRLAMTLIPRMHTDPVARCAAAITRLAA